MTSGSCVARKEHAHRVFVVEDNEATRESLLLLLREDGFDADGAENGLEALRELRAGYVVVHARGVHSIRRERNAPGTPAFD